MSHINKKEDGINTLISEVGKTCSRTYKNRWEHLADELLKLDTLIQLKILTIREYQQRKKLDEFAGLLITEEEIDNLLRMQSRNEKKLTSLAKDTKLNALLNNIEILRTTISEKIEESIKLGINLPLHMLSYLFHLSPFELDTVLICLAPELDLKYEKLYAYLQDDVTKKQPSVSLILDLLFSTLGQRNNARTYFSPQDSLLKYNFIRFTDDTSQKPLLSRCLKLDDRIANFLLEHNVMDSSLCSFAKIINPERDWSAVVIDNVLQEKLVQVSKRHFQKKSRNKLVFYFQGPYGTGKKLIAEALCRNLKLPLIIADVRQLLDSNNDLEKAIKLLFRETILQPAAIYLDHFDALIKDDKKNIHYQNVLIDALEELSFITFLAGEDSWNPQTRLKNHTFVKIECPIPAYPLRKRIWKLELNEEHPVSPEVNIDELANKFRFSGGQINDAVAFAKNLAMMRCSEKNDSITMEDLYQSCRVQSNQQLSRLAQKITPHYSWNDIVLPADKIRQLREICNCVLHRQIVYKDWGFGQKLALGKGLNILFSGATGTGKTMAAEIIANELNLDLYKIDLSCVVSKYIGETEKNLAKVFKEAETSNAVLFFDEADALFGKRSEVKDSHDRYANIEINYLLQKMEEHEGIVILASNFRKNIDEAFTRRMHFSVDFPFPDEEYRLRIWRNIFPKETPKSEDVDFEFLARRFKISGGNIKNIALNAAFLAAENSKKVNMENIIKATKREYQKMEKICVQSDFGKYYDLVMPKGSQQ